MEVNMAIKFEIQENYLVFSKNNKGWTKELNLVSWNDRDPKFDIREWDENHEKMSKGITLTEEEILKLKDCLNNLDI